MAIGKYGIMAEKPTKENCTEIVGQIKLTGLKPFPAIPIGKNFLILNVDQNTLSPIDQPMNEPI